MRHLWFLMLLTLGALLACGGGGGSSTPTPPPVPPVIASFTATPATINAGQGATLTWSVSGATSLSLSNGVGDVTGLTSKSVSPAATTTYVLTATNGGGSVAASATVTVNPAPTYDFTAVTTLLEDSPKSYPGGVLMVVCRGDQEIYRHVVGSLTDTTKQPIASATKWYSGTIVLRLAERGLFSLDDPIGKFLPAFPRPGKGDITIRQCFGMKSGLFLEDPEYETTPTLTLAQSVDQIATHTPVVFAPGTQLAYDGDGMQAVGRICEVVTGKDWRTLAQEELFGPLGMADSDYGLLFLNPGIPGGARSTLADYMKLLRMVQQGGLAANGTRYLSEASVDICFTNTTRGLPEYASAWPVSLHYANNQRPDYGFGSWILAEHPSTQLVEEVSSPGKFGTWPVVDRRRNLRTVIFTYDPNGFALGVHTNLQVLKALREAVGP